MSAMLPRDPMILLSVVNTKLRDGYPSLEELCGEIDADMDELTARLAAVGYQYDEKTNQFRSLRQEENP